MRVLQIQHLFLFNLWEEAMIASRDANILVRVFCGLGVAIVL
jgi:hypothetical protein